MRLLDRTVLQLQDLTEQPESSHVVVCPNGDYIDIDAWKRDQGMFWGFRNEQVEAVIVFPFDSGWLVYDRRIAGPVSKEAVARQAAADNRALKDLRKELGDDLPPSQPTLVEILKAAEGDDDRGHGTYL